MEKPKLAVICGPTATGKTALAVEVAKRLGGEVVSADSMQVYRGMDIGTAKPTAEEMRGGPHHLLSCAEIGERFDAAEYSLRARACIEDIASRGRLPILCGGTGLYISATVYPLDFGRASADTAYREELLEYASQHGPGALHKLLEDNDPAAASAIHPNNVRRVIRALEKLRAEDQGSAAPTPANQIFNGDPLYDLAWIGLTMDRATLNRRLDERVDRMLQAGLLDEVRKLADEYPANATAFQALGYKELIGFLNGSVPYDDSVERIKSGTRNYAKRQMTWFRREKCIHWLDIGVFTDHSELVRTTCEYITKTLDWGQTGEHSAF